MKILAIRWKDAWIDGSMDLSIEEAKLLKPIIRTTVGFFITENEDAYILSTDYYDEDGSINAPMVIPKGMVIQTALVDIGELNEDTTH